MRLPPRERPDAVTYRPSTFASLARRGFRWQDSPQAILPPEGGVLTLTFNRPEVLNAFNDQMVAELGEALQAGRARRGGPLPRPDRRGAGLLVRGRTLALRGARGGAPSTASIREHLQDGYNRIVLRMRGLEKPIIAGMNGVAAGVGLSLALAATSASRPTTRSFTHRLLARSASCRMAACPFMLPLLVGLGRASELAFTSDRIDAEEAHRLGLVNRVVPADDSARRPTRSRSNSPRCRRARSA